ncbi:MAG: aminotransferase class III-fold pyridoxal phosphate-dependent enzyme [Gemmataceae bacterium]
MSKDFLFETIATLQERHTPNFFRLYLNPHVAQTCYALNQLVRETWSLGQSDPDYQSFLANSFDEALSGAIKLARYWCHLEGRPGNGLVLDSENRLGAFASVTLNDGAQITFVPGVEVLGPDALASGSVSKDSAKIGWVVVFASCHSPEVRKRLQGLIEVQGPLVITCVSRTSLAACQEMGWHTAPDIVVFDESFVRGEVPFGAFAARQTVYDVWNKRGKANFHSTTFQPNSISTLHFMRCLEADAGDFHVRHQQAFDQLARDGAVCGQALQTLYHPSLTKTIKTLGMDTLQVAARGHYVEVNGQRIFDGVSGIACSVRGHHPPTYLEEIKKLQVDDYHREACQRLETQTGLPYMLPAVSGASAVETALRLGLAAQHPKRYVLALKGGFGGKTLFALTGTANPYYKTQLEPLYDNVVYVDPFATDAIDNLRAALDKYPVGIVQLELIQGVGGVRAVPEQVVRFLAAEREQRGYLLFVDEVQTAMFRTGPFCRARALGIVPDLMSIGKGVSDMMFPFSATLYAQAVAERLAQVAPGLIEDRRRRHDYEVGYKTLINAIDRALELDLEGRVARTSKRLGELLSTKGSAARDVRVYGMLIAIELDVRGWPKRWFRKQVHALYILNLLLQREFPLFLGFCQYEPHVLKLTPPLTTTDDEIERLGKAIARTLNKPFWQLLPALGGVLGKSCLRRMRGVGSFGRTKHEHAAH